MKASPHFDTVSRVIETLVKSGVEDGLLTHAAAFYGRLKDPLPDFKYQWLPEGRDIFDLASLTKALVTTPLVFRSVAQRGLSFDDTLNVWLGPHHASILDPRLSNLTIRSLLKHESGLPAWRNFWVCHLDDQGPVVSKDPQTFRDRLVGGLNRAAQSLCAEYPRQLYSDVGFLLLGLCLAEAEQRSIADQFFEMIVMDLQIPRDTFELYLGGVDTLLLPRTVPTAFCALRGRLLVGEVHDENAASLGGIQGHAGLFGTGEAVANYLHKLFLSPLGREVLATNADAIEFPLGNPPNEGLMGWRQGADPSSLPFAHGNAMGHMGFTGVAFWVCPQAQDYAILLTNRVSGGRTRPGIAALRREVFAALAQLRSCQAR